VKADITALVCCPAGKNSLRGGLPARIPQLCLVRGFLLPTARGRNARYGKPEKSKTARLWNKRNQPGKRIGAVL
jgi:hypothetical protein